MPNDRRFDPHTPRPDYRPGARYQTSERDRYRTGGERRYWNDRGSGYREETGYRDFDNPEWAGEDGGEQYFGTGSHYGGGFGTAPSSRASAAGASGAAGYGREGSWSDESDWRLEDEGYESHRGRGPKGYTRTDERLLETICERLTYDPRIDAREIEVEVQQQKVTLRGSVNDRRTKYAVEELVEDSGAREIDNQLRVNRL